MVEPEIPGLGVIDLERMRADLTAWREHARDALDRHDWSSAFVRYPTLDLRAVPAPFAPPPADLRQARVTLIGSAGIYATHQAPFDDGDSLGDYTFRALPAGLDLSQSALAHAHYSHAAADRDRNAVYPLERLRELVEAGEIGALTDTHFAFMGYQPDYVTLIERFIPSLIAATLAQAPDVALLVPV